MGVVTALATIGGAAAGASGLATAGSAVIGAAKVAGAASSLVGASKSLSGAKEAGRSQRGALQSQEAVTQEQYDFYKDYYRPLEEQLTLQARTGLDPRYMAQRAGQDVTQRYEVGRLSLGRQFDRLGIDPSSGRHLAALKDMQVAQRGAEAGAMTASRAATLQGNQQQLFNVAALGKNMPAQSLAGYGAIGAQYGQMAEQYGQSAGNLAGFALRAPQAIGDFAASFGGRGGGGGGGGGAGRNYVGTLGQSAIPGSSFQSSLPEPTRVGTLGQSALPGSGFKSTLF